jgi:hypothetical protein
MSDWREPVTLEEAARRAEVVLVATPGRPDHRVQRISITPGGGPPTEKYPDFGRVLYRYRVEEVLWSKGSRELPRPGTEIEIDSASWGYDFTVHKKRHLEGVNKITIHEDYQPSGAAEEGAEDPRRILFLNRWGKGWAFVCDISAEPLAMRPAVKKLLASR